MGRFGGVKIWVFIGVGVGEMDLVLVLVRGSLVKRLDSGR